MCISRAEYVAGYARIYNEFGKNVRAFPCDRLIGYGPKGIVVEYHTLILAIGLDCRQLRMTPIEFAKRQWNMHDDWLQVRC